ncbi:unnamed protein product [Pleuronectes platessa]|uniref:Uncharacterized protein n=1 Tax=Pleuronectes platessa TaxID=8262 RepID=A0A9N7TLF7_PLEPL|nr:unnamed protein product [Pleuronectes platessa]
MAADSWQLDAPFGSDLVFCGSEKPLQDWAVDPVCAPVNPDSESEDVLHGVDPNEVFRSGPPADASSESDSGISEETGATSTPTPTTPTTPMTPTTPTTLYQVVYDISGLGAVKVEPGQENVISIELGEVTAKFLSSLFYSDTCL